MKTIEDKVFDMMKDNGVRELRHYEISEMTENTVIVRLNHSITLRYSFDEKEGFILKAFSMDPDAADGDRGDLPSLPVNDLLLHIVKRTVPA
ncbi:MAG: hypothetical protein IJJ38_06470 [Lachnospiraceae bacterium]|nr:hypothetical protein [Lachnospiraceae bacterium]